MGRLIRILRRNATYKGLLGGQRGWLAMFAVFGVARFFGKYVGRDEQHLASERLRPGQSMTITTMAPPTRAERRASARSSR
jgi:hypothetical protein